MGLDVAFNREKAIAAGLKLTRSTRGDGLDSHEGLEDPEYASWLKPNV
mgnify:CR=1 FL=1